MALTKKLQALGVTGKTVYALIIRASDGYFLQSALTSFAVGVSYPALAEDATVKGLYTLSTAGVAWSDGLYSAIIYQQAGGSPAPAADQVIAGGDFNIAADATMHCMLEAEKGCLGKMGIPLQDIMLYEPYENQHIKDKLKTIRHFLEAGYEKYKELQTEEQSFLSTDEEKRRYTVSYNSIISS